MRRVQQANQRPFHCAVIPFKGNSNASGFIDTGQFLGDDKVYVSFEAAVLLAKEIGWVGPSSKKADESRIAELEREVNDLRAQLQDADKLVSAAEYSLTAFGGKLQKKPGRPKKEPVSQG